MQTRNKCIDQSPNAHKNEESKHKGPAAHVVAHLIGGNITPTQGPFVFFVPVVRHPRGHRYLHGRSIAQAFLAAHNALYNVIAKTKIIC